EAGGLGAGDAERPDHLLLVQAQQLTGRRRGAENPGGAGDVPADVVMRGVDRVADAALGFYAEDEGVQEVAAADRTMLGQSEDRRGDRAGRMDDGFQMRVVEVEDMAGNAVEQGGMEDVEPVRAPEHARLRGADEGAERGQRDVEGRMRRATDRAA